LMIIDEFEGNIEDNKALSNYLVLFYWS
jgi:hypothetical protein